MSLHIGANKGEIADKILLPGDPLRAKYIAEKYLEDIKLVNEIRAAYCYTGYYKGERVSVMGTGMGIPSIMIYATELCRDYDVEKLIRIGTGSSFVDKVHVNDIVMAEASCTTSGINDEIFKGTFAPCADFELLDACYHKAKELNLNTFVGNTVCYDLLYRDDSKFDIKTWAEYGVLGGEMESAGLYTVAAHYNKKALSIYTTVVELAHSTDISGKTQNKTISIEDRERGLNNMIELALETIIQK